MMAMTEKPQQASAKPFVLITGAAGDIGSTLTRALRDRYQIIALDRSHSDTADFSYTFDLTKRESVQLALREVSDAHGHALAAVVHLAAYFDFTGEHSPLYDSVNIEGTRHLLEALEPLLSNDLFTPAPCWYTNPPCPASESTKIRRSVRAGSIPYPKPKRKA